MNPAATEKAYWLTFAAAGALLSFAFNSMADRGSHGGSSAALGMWYVSMMVSAASIVGGAVLALIRRAEDIGIAFMAAGLGGFIATLFVS